MGAIALGNDILVMGGDIELAIIGESGTVTSTELKLLISNNMAYFTHDGDKLKLTTTTATHNIYSTVDETLKFKIITLNRESGEWVYTTQTTGTIQLDPPTADGPDDGLIREVFMPLSEKGTEYLNYTYMYYND